MRDRAKNSDLSEVEVHITHIAVELSPFWKHI